jgi:uncharacterized membrane protein YdjX (TVP38/TMEM64 family)
MKTGGSKWIAGLAFVAALAILLIYFHRSEAVGNVLKDALDWIVAQGVWSHALFVLVYVVATILLVPGSALGLGAGALFGVVRGSILVSLASTLGATCAFLLGRYLARDWVAQKIAGKPSFKAIDQAVASEGWKIVLLTRLSPVFPFTLLNYAFGLTRVSLREYVLASWLGMMPGTVMFAYLGSLARVGLENKERTPGEWALYGTGLAATVAVAVVATHIARGALAKRTTSAA